MAMSDLRLLGSCGRNWLQVLGPCQEGSFEQGAHGSAALLKEAFGVGQSHASRPSCARTICMRGGSSYSELSMVTEY